jgi:(p)ppGpp synthase/HD superfamily hydrolase
MIIENLTKKEIEASRILLDLTLGIEHSGKSFFSHLYNTFYILKKMNLDEDTCLAGMYHSIYGTEYFKIDKQVQKDEVIKTIGQKANKLVEYFCTENRNDFILNGKIEDQDRLSLLYILYANEIEQRGEKNILFLNKIKEEIGKRLL